jgi:hypothetical protein
LEDEKNTISSSRAKRGDPDVKWIATSKSKALFLAMMENYNSISFLISFFCGD